MEIMQYRSLAGAGKDERIINKSRFVGQARPVESESEALAFIARVKDTHRDASAHAYGYIDGLAQNVQRFHDGGEPSGTAGMPILTCMLKQGLTRCVCVVTRWFGGIKLGAGGLARAFGGCAAAAVADAGIALWERSVRVRVTLDYSLLGRVENALAQTPYVREDTVFADAVTLQLLVRARQVDALRAQFADWTDARARVEAAPEAFFHPWPTDA